jgi:hypothetical protein
MSQDKGLSLRRFEQVVNPVALSPDLNP